MPISQTATDIGQWTSIRNNCVLASTSCVGITTTAWTQTSQPFGKPGRVHQAISIFTCDCFY